MILSRDGFCHAKRGLLTLRECGKHALSSCVACGTGLCEDHQILTGYGVFCPDCAAADDRFGNVEDERLERARFRTSSGYYYEEGYYYHFTATDFAAFDTKTSGAGEPALAEGVQASGLESDDDDSDSDDLDSSMES